MNVVGGECPTSPSDWAFAAKPPSCCLATLDFHFVEVKVVNSHIFSVYFLV